MKERKRGTDINGVFHAFANIAAVCRTQKQRGHCVKGGAHFSKHKDTDNLDKSGKL